MSRFRVASRRASDLRATLCLARPRCCERDRTSHTGAANRGNNADQAAVHDGRQVTLREDPVPPRHVRDQEPGRLGRLPARELRGPRALEPGRRRHPGAEVLPQGRRAGAPEARRGDAGSVLAVALDRRRAARWPSCPQSERSRRRDRRPPGVRPPGRHLDLLGLEGRLFHHRGRRARLLRRAPLHAGDADRRAEQPAVVQHRPALGLRHRRSRPGPLLRRPRDGRADGLARRPTSIPSRTPASSSRSRTISSTRTASWTCGCARRASSSTARAPAPTSPSCAPRTRSCRAAASRRA